MDFLSRLNNRLKPILEDDNAEAISGDAEWKDPSNAGYDRQYAEDCLYHTIGPLTDSPRWVAGDWTSNSSPPPEFVRGGPAPRWTEDQVVVAMAGDPNLMWNGSRGNPRSPYYGNKGGAPILRSAVRIAKKYGKSRDEDFLIDLYQNGLVTLTKLMQKGYDASYKPFISYTKRTIEGSMLHGLGTTAEVKKGSSLVNSILDQKIDFDNQDTREAVAQQLRDSVEIVDEHYRRRPSHEKDAGNPFGHYSSKIFKAVNALADAVEAGDSDYGNKALDDLRNLATDLDDEQTLVLGASTGMGQAISTGDRTSSVGIVSASEPTSPNSDTALDATLPAAAQNVEAMFGDRQDMVWLLEHACKRDISNEVKGVRQLEAVITKVAGVHQMNPKDAAKAMKPFTANMWRYCLRAVGPIANPYYGEGVMRSSLQIPRDANGWWKQGEDPEIDQSPDGTPWESEWRKGGREVMEMPEIAREMGREVQSLAAAGIATARGGRVETDAAGNPVVMTTQSVNMTVRPALYKLYMLAALHELTDVDYFEEGKRLDLSDRMVIAESARFLAAKLQRAIDRGTISEMCERIKAICG
jgi:hypothetical protein